MDITSILEGITTYINIPYIIIVNIIVFFIIKNLEVLNKEKIVSKLQKKIVALIVNIAIIVVYLNFISSVSLQVLLLSAVFTPIVYNFVLKNMLEKLSISYNKSDIEML